MRHYLCVVGLLSVAAGCGSSQEVDERLGWAQDALVTVETQELLASDGASGDLLGLSSCIVDGYAIVGASNGDGNGTNSGSAYVFERDANGSWVEQQKLTASDGAQGDGFGFDVSISGQYAFVAAWKWVVNGTGSGFVYVFERDANGAWLEHQKLTAADRIGASLASFGDNLVVGAPSNADDPAIGAVYLFERGSGGVWTERQRLTASTGVAHDGFGHGVAIWDDYVIVGADTDDDHGERSGSAYVFERDAHGDWLERQKLTASDAAAGDWFGVSVDLSGGNAIIGADFNDDNGSNSGSAYIFERGTDGNWREHQKLTASGGGPEDSFGWSVGISQQYAVVGAWGNDEGGEDGGAAYLFRRDSTGFWLERAKLWSSDREEEDFFGDSVGIFAGTTLVGAPGHDHCGSRSGSAYVFENSCLGQADGTPCDDGRFCNGIDFCNQGICESSGDPCEASASDGDLNCAESCDEATDSCTAPDPDGTLCDDGKFCTGEGACASGVCVLAGDPCAAAIGDADDDCSESCDEVERACTLPDPDGASCDDGVYCNGPETCWEGVCASSGGNPCPGADRDGDCRESCDETADACTAPDPDGSPCGEGTCASGMCQYGPGAPPGGFGAPPGSSRRFSFGCSTLGRSPAPPLLPLLMLGLLAVRVRRFR
ncbi:MAG: FG-GAP repeat protein [Deltaproteobacteria bacterium]|jgi:uncharacterized protein (TIGR03382 family)|nr:FG-GAP repeat protein [Deltaproteobacteria bacterium]MBW2531472.1 FG-GAP repeat protein [Deltaproteobacteria bacterium]